MTFTFTQRMSPADATRRVLAAARTAANLSIDGTFTVDDLTPVLDEVDRGPVWLRTRLDTLVDGGQVAAVLLGEEGLHVRAYRLVLPLYRIISGDVAYYYGAGTRLNTVRALAKRLYLERNTDVWTSWKRHEGGWSLVAVDDDAETDEHGRFYAWHTSVRIEVVDINVPGALEAGQVDGDMRPFIVTVTDADGGQDQEQVTGQVTAEAIIAQAVRIGGQATAVMDFDAEAGCSFPEAQTVAISG